METAQRGPRQVILETPTLTMYVLECLELLLSSDLLNSGKIKRSMIQKVILM